MQVYDEIDGFATFTISTLVKVYPNYDLAFAVADGIINMDPNCKLCSQMFANTLVGTMQGNKLILLIFIFDIAYLSYIYFCLSIVAISVIDALDSSTSSMFLSAKVSNVSIILKFRNFKIPQMKLDY